MHICDKCKKYNKCYPYGMSKAEEAFKRTNIELDGCPDFKELTVEKMFGLKDGVLSKEN